ncbi:prepilin-type N-terminal cleavage/methylation domain-containing protein [Candidatus Uhrbacteria bacterium]|nr:prepilin-type N-terminal cleavage/methylation domain-containing protein [Candidatus Uhrbacteria bacterium]MBD3284332.1 prepilin-type N-terminal cleavage/methylation domain-containing protein [Candidatus Uhrbacteria bacterium]
MKRSKGFTLIELLVVIAIIGLLATISVVIFRGAQEKARDASRVADMVAVAKALSLAASQSIPMTGCASSGELVEDCVISGSNFLDFSTIQDPRAGATDLCPGTAVAATTADIPCRYTIWANGSPNPEPDDYRIIFFLEAGTGDIGPGGHEMTQDGILN